jgi:energy-coupling factor transport system ATP-binding protein
VEVEGVELVLDSVLVKRGDVSIRASGTFSPGVHLVTGSVGTGKSTLALVAAGLLFPAEGSVERRRIARSMLLFQFPEWHLTGRSVREEITSFGVPVEDVLSRSGLSGRGGEDPFSLSRGELKRLLLSCVLARDDDLLILDEPFSGLDCPGKILLCNEIGEKRRGIVILCTHERHFLPRVDVIWEFNGHTLACRGRVPGAIASWQGAPAGIKALVAAGRIPRNVTFGDIREAACRTRV